jgi:hypothetical protein
VCRAPTEYTVTVYDEDSAGPIHSMIRLLIPIRLFVFPPFHITASAIHLTDKPDLPAPTSARMHSMLEMETTCCNYSWTMLACFVYALDHMAFFTPATVLMPRSCGLRLPSINNAGAMIGGRRCFALGENHCPLIVSSPTLFSAQDQIKIWRATLSANGAKTLRRRCERWRDPAWQMKGIDT